MTRKKLKVHQGKNSATRASQKSPVAPTSTRGGWDGTHTCGGCDARWTALGAAHCSACHRTFAGVSLFDTHRSSNGEQGKCKNPNNILNNRGEHTHFYRNEMWRGPELTDDVLDRMQQGA